MINKRRFVLIITIGFTLIISMAIGCAPKSTSKPVSESTKDANVKKIDFQELKIQSLESSIKNIFEPKKNYKGYFSFKAEDGYWYIGIFSGKKNTGGYTIKVLTVDDVEGKTVVIVQETSPKPSMNVTDALTYPYTVIRAKDITQPIVVKDELGEVFKDINKLGNLE